MHKITLNIFCNYLQYILISLTLWHNEDDTINKLCGLKVGLYTVWKHKSKLKFDCIYLVRDIG